MKAILTSVTKELPTPPYPEDTALPPPTREQILDLAERMGAPRWEAEQMLDVLIADGKVVPGDS